MPDDEAIGRAIREIRSAAGFTAAQLANQLGISESKISRWESGDTRVRASELAQVAGALGVSPMAILDPTSFVAKLAASPRTMGLRPATNASDVVARVTALSEFHQLFASSGFAGTPSRATKVPSFDSPSWTDEAEHLAAWAWTEIGADLDAVGDSRFDALVYGIEYGLEIDVLVEPFPNDDTLGLALTAPEFPLIVVNSAKPRRQALFTLVHELAHVLRSDGQLLWGDATMSAAGDHNERFANAFAASFLMPRRVITEVLGTADRVSDFDQIGRLLTRFGVSIQTLTFRLHNLRLINAGQRDGLRNMSPYEVATRVEDPEVRRRLGALDGSPSYESKPPQHLLNRAAAAYRARVISIGPVAGLLRLDDDVARQYVGVTLDAGAGLVGEHIDFSAGPDIDVDQDALADLDPIS